MMIPDKRKARLAGNICRKGGIYMYPDRYEWRARIYMLSESDAQTVANTLLRRVVGKRGKIKKVGERYKVVLHGKEEVEKLQEVYDECMDALRNMEFDGNPFLDMDKENFLWGFVKGVFKSGMADTEYGCIFHTHDEYLKNLLLKILIELGIDHKILGNGPWRFKFTQKTREYLGQKKALPSNFDW